MLMATVEAREVASPLPVPPGLSVTDFSALLAAVYEGPMEPVPWGHALEMLRKQLGASYVSFILRSPASDRSGLAVHASAHGTSLEPRLPTTATTTRSIPSSTCPPSGR